MCLAEQGNSNNTSSNNTIQEPTIQNQTSNPQINETTTAAEQNSTNKSTQSQNNSNNHTTDQIIVDAQNAILSAKGVIDSSADADVRDARAILDQANLAFESGNYGLALKLATQARQLAYGSQPINHPGIISPPIQVTNQNTTDWLIILILGVVVLSVGGIWFFLRGKNS